MRRIILIFLAFFSPLLLQGGPVVSGVVTCGGDPVAGVPVSDGVNIVLTGEDGSYSLETDKAYGLVFITPPSGYVPVTLDGVQPAFYARLGGGDAPEVHDFKLEKQDQGTYTALFVTDIHLTNTPRKQDVKLFRKKAMPAFRKVAAEAASAGPVYTFNLGDLSHERYWYQNGYDLRDAYNTLKESSFPTLMYSVPGNHDNDCAVLTSNTDFDAGHLYREVLGPEYYSVNIGSEHWLMMDDIIYENDSTIHRKPWPQGSAGSISYSRGFTRTQMEWLEKDLALVPSEMNIVICSHSPVSSDNSRGTTFRETQMDSLAALLQRFGKVEVYAGHMHRMQFIHNEQYPQFEACTVSAFSGDMWESFPNRLLGIEGEEGGTLMVRFSGNGRETQWRSHQGGGNKVIRCYDLNKVGKMYRRNPDIRRQMEAFPQRNDYSQEGYRNVILVNYWMFRSGETVCIYENGKPLEVKKVTWEDPLFNINYYLPSYLGDNRIAPSQDKVPNRHMFAATAESSRSTVTVEVRDGEGKVLHRERMRRPKAFRARM